MNIKHSKKNLLSFLTALSISLGASGCSSYPVKEIKNDVSTEDDKLSSMEPEQTLTPKQREAIRINKIVDDYLDYFNSVEVEYPNEKYYPTKKEIKKQLSNYDTYQEYNHTDSISMKELFKIVQKNSNKYARKHEKYKTAFPNINSKNYISQVNSEFAFKMLLQKLQEKATNDFSETICKMKDLKIVFGKLNEGVSSIFSNTLAIYHHKKNLIVLDIESINNLKNNKRIYIKNDKYEIVLKHELFHLDSVSCKHRIKKGQKFSSILDYSALFEAAAESSSYALDDDYYANNGDYTYENEREDESLILLLGLFHDNKTYDDYYNSIKDSNPESFYDFCGAKSEKEKINLFKIISAIDGRNGFNNTIFNKKNTNILSKAKLEKVIRYNYKNDIFNKVLSNMVEYTINNPNFTIEKNIKMLNIVENCLLDDTLYLNKKNSYDQNFIIDFYNSETKYFEFLSQYYFKGKKNNNYIKKHYADEYIEYDPFYNFIKKINSNELIEEFPLLKPILFTHESACYNNEMFFEDNQKIIKQKCKTK